MQQENGHLGVLSTLHYVYGGMKIFGSLFLFIYFFMGAAMIYGGAISGEYELQIVGGFFIIFTIFLFTLFFISGLVTVLCGYFLSKKKYRIFCIVVSAIECMNFPLGTALGVFTIIELEKPEIKNSFDIKPELISADK